jgi:cytochrome bd-type quinol oxidase subunit 2
VRIENAAASPKTLVFMLTGIGMLLPVMLIYNGYQYLVFRGKVGRAVTVTDCSATQTSAQETPEVFGR